MGDDTHTPYVSLRVSIYKLAEPESLVLVELFEVAGDDGDGEREHQHPRDGAERPHQLTHS